MENEKQAEPYQKLAAAIVIQAVADFRKALRHLEKGKGNLELDIKTMNEVIRFIHSKWYSTLTTVHSEIILNQLKKEVEHSGIKKMLGYGRYQEFLEKTFQDFKEDRIHQKPNCRV